MSSRADNLMDLNCAALYLCIKLDKSWSEGMDAMGIDTYRPQKKDRAEREARYAEIEKRYRAGEPAKSIAKSLKCSTQLVYRVIENAGVISHRKRKGLENRGIYIKEDTQDGND